jgi:hypothetical protein
LLRRDNWERMPGRIGRTARRTAMRRMVRVWVVAVFVAAIVFGSSALAGVVPQPVQGGPGDQGPGMANSGWVTWTYGPRDRPRHIDALARAVDGDPFRLNAAGTRGFTGGLSDDGDEAILQQITDRGASNIFLYDLALRERSPAPINTDKWEAHPSVSDGYILFERQTAKWRVILYDRAAHTSTVIDEASARCFCLFSGQVSDDYATWTDCSGATGCQVRYYDIAGESSHKVPNTLDKQQYSPGVSGGTGNIYFIRSGAGCGVNTRIMRWNPIAGGEPGVLYSEPAGIDFQDPLMVFADPGTHDDVYFGDRQCDGSSNDLEVLPDADTIVTGRISDAAAGTPGGSKFLVSEADLRG